MSKLLGIICCNYKFNKLHELNQNRPTAAIPVGGRYAIIDFPLSNMVNAGVRSVGIIMPTDYRPILDHIRSGKSWGLNRKSGGLFILPGVTNWVYGNNKFSINDLRKNIDFLKSEYADYVILSGSNSIINIDYKEVLDSHIKSESDITLIYKKESRVNCDDQAMVLHMEEDGRVNDIVESGKVDFSECNIFTEQVIISRDLLLELLLDPVEEKEVSFIEIVKDKLDFLKIQGYGFKGFYASIYSKDSYFAANMAIMDPLVSRELFLGKNKIVTKTKDNPPTKYTSDAKITDALVSSGCIIAGEVEHSLIFRGVKVKKGAKIKNCIIMHECKIKSDAVLENVILDKSVKISKGVEIIGQKGSPTFIPKFKSL